MIWRIQSGLPLHVLQTEPLWNPLCSLDYLFQNTWQILSIKCFTNKQINKCLICRLNNKLTFYTKEVLLLSKQLEWYSIKNLVLDLVLRTAIQFMNLIAPWDSFVGSEKTKREAKFSIHEATGSSFVFWPCSRSDIYIAMIYNGW